MSRGGIFKERNMARTKSNEMTIKSLEEADGGLVSKCFNRFYEDVPRNPALLRAYKTMSLKTQAAVEDYLAAVEQEEE